MFHVKNNVESVLTILAYSESIAGQCYARHIIQMLENHRMKISAILPAGFMLKLYLWYIFHERGFNHFCIR